MPYDIFISYRREGGRELARSLKSELERRGYRVFLDFDELNDGIFDRRIMEAIDAAPIFMVLLSPHALDRCVNADDWVRREIEYALSHDRHVVPIDPDRSFSGFPPGISEVLKKSLGQHQFSEIMFGQLFKESIDKMVRNRIEPLLQRVGRAASRDARPRHRLKLRSNADCRICIDGEERAEIKAGKMAFISLEPGEYWLEAFGTAGDTVQNIAREIVMDSRDRLEQLVFVLRTYKIGDYYHENGKEGIVFEVDASGRHGKIMAMHDLSEKLAWCTKEEYETCRETEKMIGATDEQDGMKNLEVVRRIPSWREKYPAFSSCTTLGNEWYLPSRYEMQKLFDNREILSNIVENFGGQVLKNECYWSSFEVNAYNAAFFIFGNRNFGPIKFNLYRVRPITIF